MGIFENTILVDKKVSVGNTVGRIACIVFILIFLLLSFTPIAPGLFLLPAVLVGVVFYFLHMGTQVEYEYTYIEGRLSFAKITAKRKRKELAEIDMEELLMIAPEGSSDLHTYHNMPKGVVCKNYTSGMDNVKVYEVVYKLGEGIGIIKFEPDNNMLELMQPQNVRKVIIAK